MRLLDRAPVVVAPVLGGEEPAAAKARDRQSFFSDGRRGGLQTHGGDLIAPGRNSFDAMPRAAVDDLRERPLFLDGRGVQRQLHFKSSGATSLGRMSGISGQMMMAASISSIGISMIIVSLSANLSGTLATAHEIIRHKP